MTVHIGSINLRIYDTIKSFDPDDEIEIDAGEGHRITGGEIHIEGPDGARRMVRFHVTDTPPVDEFGLQTDNGKICADPQEARP
jgi:hypothetical protein